MGVNYLPVLSMYNCFSITGISTRADETTLPARLHRQFRHKVEQQDLYNWVENVLVPIEMEITRHTQEIADYIVHNFQWPLNAAQRNAELLYISRPEAIEKDKIDALPSEQRNLVKALELLKKCIDLAHTSVNPSFATEGPLRAKPMYRLLARFSWMFKETALSNKKEIELSKDFSYGSCNLYDSFEIVLLLLIENAIKYGDPGSTILLRCVDDRAKRNVLVEIESVGKSIPDDLRQQMFLPGTQALKGNGKGLGLHFARQIAEANNVRLEYQFREPRQNVFSMKIPAVHFTPTVGIH